MNNNFKTIIFSWVAILVSASLFAVDDDVSNTIDVPQTLELSSPSDPSIGDATSGSAVISTAWTVTSNNAFAVSFTGTSVNDAGGSVSYPQFSKEDKDASGSGKGTYDTLDTTFGVVISGHDSVGVGATWAGGSSATGTPENLVLALDAIGSPDASVGSIMTDDDVATATVTLHAKGMLETADQSGDYTLAVTIVTTAEEQ